MFSWNRGQATFKAARAYGSSECETSSIASGDFNQDGNEDLAVTASCFVGTEGKGQVTIWLGKPNGIFQRGATFPSEGRYVSSLHVADFNNDTKLDLVAATNFTMGNGSAGVSVLLGNGDMHFSVCATTRVARGVRLFSCSRKVQWR